ncbi:MAG TPA: hypothetical protein PLJ47_15955, partial [Candidatus Hydrogenedentes bacterium]|nr:hypothetical protein [Candidatus Hydrogenedentota bacterium]
RARTPVRALSRMDRDRSSILSQTNSHWDLWTLPAYMLWLVFFLVGFDPELLFFVAREAGMVATQSAMVNSPHVITIALAGYLGYFAYQRCLDVPIESADAKARGLQFAILGLIAFLAFSPFQMLSIGDIPVRQYRMIILFVGGTKLVTWFLLLGVIARYYLLGHAYVFAGMVSVFPSTYENAEPEKNDAAPAEPPPTPKRPQADAGTDL